MRKNIRYILGFYGKSSKIDFVPHLHLIIYSLHILLNIIQVWKLDNSTDSIKSVQTARLMLNNKYIIPYIMIYDIR